MQIELHYSVHKSLSQINPIHNFILCLFMIHYVSWQAQDFSHLYCVQAGCGASQPPYPMGTGGDSLWGKAVGA
jgi:hypothetical protein